MKKSQILAALALAFALGVVAPVANTVVSGETHAVEARAAETATKAEVNTAVSKVENYAQYKVFKALIDALVDYNNDTLSDDTSKLKDATPAGLSGEIAKAVDAINGVDPSTTTYIDLDAAINAAGRVDKYTAYENLFTLMEEDNSKVTATNLRAKMLAINGSNSVKNDTLNMTVSELKNYVNTNAAFTKYASYADLFNAVADAKQYDDIVDRLEATLNNAQEWNKNKDGKTPVDLALDAADPAKALFALRNDVTGYDEYYALDVAIEAAKTTADNNGQTTHNQELIDNINAALEAATEVVPGDKVSLDDLKAGTGTGEGTNKPGEGDNNGGNKAPDTGILANAEGNASTTVAMVAGIATALTAAGAGVVAYRNARRSSRK